MFQIAAIYIGRVNGRDHVLPETFDCRRDAEAEALARNCKAFVPFYFQVEERAG